MIARVHAQAWQQLRWFAPSIPLEPVVQAVCTSRATSAAAAAAAFGAQRSSSDPRAIIEADDVDVVHICSPNQAHAPALLATLAAQKPCYCDKPLTATLAEAETVAAALPAYRATAQMTLNNRFWPAIQQARRLLAEGLLGQLLEVRASYLHGGSADPAAPLKWKLSAAAGGGVVADLAVHIVDLVEYLVGDLRRLTARGHIAYPERPDPADPSRRLPVDAEDSVHILAEGADAANVSIQASKLCNGAQDELDLALHGSDGAIRFSSLQPQFLQVYRPAAGGWLAEAVGRQQPAPMTAFPGPKFALGWLETHVACLAHFAQALAEGRPAEPDLGRGVELQRRIETIRRAAATGSWMTCEEPLA